MNYKDQHITLTAKDIAAGYYDAMELVSPLWWSVSIYDGKARYDADLAPFTPAQRAALAVLWLDAEVNNGGFYQFFSNSTGIVWEDALNGFRLFGLNRLALILEDVLAQWGSDVPFERSARNAHLDAHEELGFDANDSAYYDSDEDIDDAIVRYASAHPEEFVFDGQVRMPETMLR